jgi:hypothetical protein
MPNPIDAHVSIFLNAAESRSIESTSVGRIWERIQTGRYAFQIKKLRALLASEGPEAYARAKKSLPGVTFGGTFRRRANADLRTASGLLGYDFDNVPDLANAKAQLREDPRVVCLFVSPSGMGLKVVVWASGIADARTYTHAWRTVLDYLRETYPAVAACNDEGCSDIARLCFLSYDPEAYLNLDAHLFDVPQYQPPPPSTEPLASPEEHCPDYATVSAALAVIPGYDDYTTWITMGMALHHCGQPWARGLWDGWSARSAKYDAHVQQQKWQSFSKERDHAVHLGTLLTEAYRHGWRRQGHINDTTLHADEPAGDGPQDEQSFTGGQDTPSDDTTASPTHDWPEPTPLADGLPPVAAFDFALLPAKLRPWAEDICERMQCPPDYVGAAAMTALSGTLGRRVGIRPQRQTDWAVVANLWGLVIGRPGLLKSPAMEAALTPMKGLGVKAKVEYEEVLADYRLEAKVAQLRLDAAEKTARKKLAENPTADIVKELLLDEPAEPTMQRFIANDTTAAALGELLRQNPNGLLVYRDEIVSLLKSLDREDQAEARGFYLTAWNGDSAYTFDRIGRGLHLSIPAVCLAILGSSQPGRIASYISDAVRGGTGDDGLMQRFGLLVWPDACPTWKDVDRKPAGAAWSTANEVFEKLAHLVPENIGAQRDEYSDMPYLRLDDAALEIFRDWRAKLETQLRSQTLHPALEAHFAKYRKLVPALALLCHLADGGTGLVGEEAILRSLSWAEYLDSHARRAYASVLHTDVKVAHAIVDKLRRGELSRPFTARDVYNNQWALLSERAEVLDALGLLVDHHYLRAEKVRTGGRQKHLYHLSPRVTL